MSIKREKSTRQQTIETMKAQREAHFKEAKQYKNRMKPLVDFLRTKQLKFSHAQVGNERIQYFRLDEFEKTIEANKDHIEKNEKLSELIKKSSSQFIFFRRPDQIKIKYPKTLQPVLANNSDKKFASFRFDTTESRYGMTIFIIFLILMLVMFPIWPYEVKYGIWLVSLIILIILVGIIVIRLVVYLVIVVFNYHIWIFPNFLNSSGFWDSFIPFIEVSKGDKSWLNIFIRLFAISSFILLVLHVYLNPTFIDENIAFTKETIMEVHDWGVHKLKNQGNFSQRALTNLDKILNQTADVHEDVYVQSTPDINQDEYEPNYQNQQESNDENGGIQGQKVAYTDQQSEQQRQL